MNNTFRIELVAAFLCGLIVARAGALTVTTVSHVARPSSSTYGAEQISGITYAGGDLFYAVDDNDKKLTRSRLRSIAEAASLPRQVSPSVRVSSCPAATTWKGVRSIPVLARCGYRMRLVR